MAKEIKFKIEDEKLILSEDAKKDDFILLENIESYSKHLQEIINNKIKEASENAVKIFKDSPEYQALKEKNQHLNAENSDLIKELKYQKELADANIKNAVDNFKTSDEFIKLREENINLKKDKNQLESNIDQLKKNHEQELNQRIENAINNFKANGEYNDLKQENTTLKSDLKNWENNFNKNLELEQEKFKLLNSDEIKQKNEKITELTKEIESLKREKSHLNIKVLGNKLESWSFDTYNNELGTIFNDSTFLQANNINGTKPDFVFSIYDQPLDNLQSEEDKNNHLISKTILEMKTESPDSNDTNRKKNFDHLAKLEKDRNNNSADFAILVTELEKDNDFIININAQYPNIFIVRPAYFIYLLMIIHKFAVKDLSLKKEYNFKKIEFANSNQILNEFNEIKDSILKTTLHNIENKINVIEKEAKKLLDIAENIFESIRIIIGTHLNTIKNKIENFNIRKIVNKIEKSENDQYHYQPNLLNKEFKTDEDKLIKKEITKQKEN